MFTGIVQNRGKILSKKKQGTLVSFSFQLKRKEKKSLVLGESISVNGTCLTAKKIRGKVFEVDVIRETLEATTLGDLKKGQSVNLERALRAGDLVGGHFLTGHVDGRGKIAKIEKRGKNRAIWIQAPKSILKFTTPKGSIGVEGISLTIQEKQGALFKIGLIPHTLQETNLSDKKVGDQVNLEVDLIARYIKMFSRAPKMDFREANKKLLKSLKKNGF